MQQENEKPQGRLGTRGRDWLANKNAKDERNEEIRNLYRLGGHTIRRLAVEYNISPGRISQILKGSIKPLYQKKEKA